MGVGVEPSSQTPPRPFTRGDVNSDGWLDVTDLVILSHYLLSGRVTPPCLKSADADDSGVVNLIDVTVILNGIFGLRGRLPDPGDCGADPTEDELSCVAFPPCR